MIQTNCKKYANKQYIMHTTDERGTMVQRRNPALIAQGNAEKEICLNCTKKKCSGSYEWFKKRKGQEER